MSVLLTDYVQLVNTKNQLINRLSVKVKQRLQTGASTLLKYSLS